MCLEKQMGRVRGGQAPLVKEGQVRVNPWRHLLGGGVTGAGVTSSLQSGADKDVQGTSVQVNTRDIIQGWVRWPSSSLTPSSLLMIMLTENREPQSDASLW